MKDNMFKVKGSRISPRMLYQLLCVMLALSSLSFVVVAQGTTESLCKIIESRVLRPLAASKVQSRRYPEECVFQIYWANGDRVKLWVEKHVTKVDAQTSITESRDAFTAFDDLDVPSRHQSVPINGDGFWDEAFSYSSHYADNFVLLQKDVFEITMTSNNHRNLADLEREFRTNGCFWRE